MLYTLRRSATSEFGRTSCTRQCGGWVLHLVHIRTHAAKSVVLDAAQDVGLVSYGSGSTCFGRSWL